MNLKIDMRYILKIKLRKVLSKNSLAFQFLYIMEKDIDTKNKIRYENIAIFKLCLDSL